MFDGSCAYVEGIRYRSALKCMDTQMCGSVSVQNMCVCRGLLESISNMKG